MHNVDDHRRKPMVYIAGPYTSGDPMINTRRAMDAFEQIRQLGAVPFCPHHSAFQQLVHPLSWEEWLEYDFHILSRCDMLFRLWGPSPGADMEVNWAGQLEIPVYSEPQATPYCSVVLPSEFVQVLKMFEASSV